MQNVSDCTINKILFYFFFAPTPYSVILWENCGSLMSDAFYSFLVRIINDVLEQSNAELLEVGYRV